MVQSDTIATDVMCRLPLTRQSLPIPAQQSFGLMTIRVPPLLKPSKTGSVGWTALMHEKGMRSFPAVRREALYARIQKATLLTRRLRCLDPRPPPQPPSNSSSSWVSLEAASCFHFGRVDECSRRRTSATAELVDECSHRRTSATAELVPLVA